MLWMSMKKKLATEYVLKSIYDDKINEYEQKLISYKNDHIHKDAHAKQVAELESRLKEEYASKELQVKSDCEQKITPLEQKVALLEDKNLNLKTSLKEATDFIREEKEMLEQTLSSERKKGTHSIPDTFRNQKSCAECQRTKKVSYDKRQIAAHRRNEYCFKA
ncbi:MAG: hypothetical protein AYP45_18345 [Candidatus Brocadia carolinensis]|uniref:Uncharacterized protein n=1 Tax=Candidatus Brocadia carolinensis TaxID=1004156 RepID=A0A1V4ANY1_9BACT|nr:MAG: hypothetical protein AYP45_18345 [Candidatus Brocadia caroliniensis]